MAAAVRGCVLAGIVLGAVFLAGPPALAAEPASLKLPGRVAAYERTDLYARIVGYVQQVQVDIGDRVKKGQVLAELAVPEMAANLKRKEALLRQADAEIQHAEQVVLVARATLAAADAAILQAEAGVKQAQAQAQFAKVQYARMKALYEAKSIEATVLEEKEHQQEAARANLETAEVKVRVAQAARASATAGQGATEAGVKVAAAQREAARAAVQQQAALLQYARVVAPFDGVVTRRLVAVGDLAGPPNPHGQPLFTVARVDLVRVVVAVPEARVARLQVGTAAVVEIDALPGQKFPGKVARTAGSLDSALRSLRAEIDLPNAAGKLLPGMSGAVTLALGKE